MDEPSSGVDPENRRQIWTLIESLKDQETAIILTTHHLEEAEYLSEDVAILSKGKVVIQGDPSTITSKFGIGYRITVDNCKSETEKNNVINYMKKSLGV
jgi:ATP-binding cassette, subfamily A (ABC1), member 3